jgi:hypothetical protein
MEVSGQFHTSAALLPGKVPFGTCWIGVWASTRAGMEDVE